VELPVLILVAKFELSFKLTAALVTVNPNDPVSNPADVTVPLPVVEIFPLVVNASPAFTGDNVVPVRFQNPTLPEDGAVVVKSFGNRFNLLLVCF
jgi:hypothetical protein